MAETDCIPFRDTGYFSQLICDYLDQKPELSEFYKRFPVIDNFEKQIGEKSAFPKENRPVLVKALRQQYQKLDKPEVDLSVVDKNIETLGEESTFTITTGHQLNIFTGPLYFIYKIVSTINLSRKLKERFPDKHFVPVYWMASEDHDFEEINFINLYGGRLRWEREFAGPVGRFDTKTMEPVIRELEEHLGPGTRCEELIALFRKAYLQHENLADATRYLVHHLFGEEGLIIIGGDDPELKKLMQPYFEKDLFEQLSHQFAEESTQKLEDLHFKQVHPRPINLFYIKDGLRERIERKEDKWVVLNTEIVFTGEQLRKELQKHPERFSPNVVLRPLYQEVILPNLAYIGGGGELAYWFQLQRMFEEMDVPFPMLVLRNSVLWIDQKRQKKMEDLGLKLKEIFQPLHEIKKQYVKERAPVDAELTPYEQKLQRIFDELEDVAHLTDRSMLGAVNAQRQKQLNGLENLKKKLIKAEKRKHSVDMDKLERVYYQLFPNGSLQERHDNFTTYYCEFGDDFIKTLLEKLDPLDFRFVVVRE